MTSSFAEEVAAARSRVVAVVRPLAGDDAEDVVQEAILRAFLSRSSLRDRTKFEAWLCGIALNVAKQRRRRAATEARLLGGSLESSGAAAACSDGRDEGRRRARAQAGGSAAGDDDRPRGGGG